MPAVRLVSDRRAAAPVLRAVGEAVLLVLVAGSPWLFAGTSAAAEFALTAGVALLALLWAAHTFLTRRLAVRPDLTSASLGGLLLLSAVQLVPLPEAVVRVVSPAAANWHQVFRPAVAEQLPGEPPGAARSDRLPLTVDRFRTRRFLADVAAVLLVYLAARNWLSGAAELRRLAWASTLSGAGLAVLAVAQFFSSPRHVVYWTFPTGGQVFGPFVNKNHYPDYVGPCLGLAVGLALAVRRRTGSPALPFDAPGRLLAGVAAIGMAASLPLSLSRGGVLAAAVAAVLVGAVAGYRAGGRGMLVAALAAAAVGLGGWFGWEPVEARLRTLWAPGVADDRMAVWRDSLQLVPGVLAVGTGGGTFAQVEPLVRASGLDSSLVYEHAHNEFVEAAVEGGLVRLLLTAGLIVGAVGGGLRAANRMAGRSAGRMAAGGLFGLVLLAAHAAVDFGPHIPAVALLAAALAGHLAAAADPGYLPQRMRVDRHGRTTYDATPAEPDRRLLTATGLGAVGIGIGLAAVGLAIAWDAGLWAAGDRFRQAGDRAGSEEARIAAAVGWAAATPADTDAQLALAQAHFDFSRDLVTTGGMAVAGGWAGLTPAGASGEHRRAGLAAARAARDASPLTAAAHARLGRYAAGFAAADRPRAYYERAKRANPGDPFVRLALANEAAAAGDRAAAVADWQAAVVREPRLVKPVLTAAHAAGLPPDRIVSELLPADPVVLLAAADALYPPGDSGRRPFLAAAAGADGDPSRLSAAAAAAAELGDGDRAVALWERAIDAADRTRPADAVAVRDTFARWLEADERWESAVLVLRWLRSANLRHAAFRDRLAAAEHALKLQRVIDGR